MTNKNKPYLLLKECLLDNKDGNFSDMYHRDKYFCPEALISKLGNKIISKRRMVDSENKEAPNSNDNYPRLKFTFKPNSITRMRFDIDLNIPFSEENGTPPPKSLYTLEDILWVGNRVNFELRKKVTKLAIDHQTYLILEKEGYYDGKSKFKNGFHLEWLSVFLPNHEIVSIVRTVVDAIVQSGRFKGAYQPDYQFPKNDWLMYGCSKLGSSAFYQHTCTVYPFHKNKVVPREDEIQKWDFSTLFKALWLYPKSEDTIYYIDDYKNQVEVEGEDLSEEEDTCTLDKSLKGIEKIKFMLDHLAPCRVEQSKYWYQIVRAVRNSISEFEYKIGGDIVDEWSQRTTKFNYDYDSLLRVWNDDTDDSEKYNLGTIDKYFKIDTYKMSLIKNGTDRNLARLIYFEWKGSLYMSSETNCCYFDTKSKLWKKEPIIGLYSLFYPTLEKLVKEAFTFYDDLKDDVSKKCVGTTLKTIQSYPSKKRILASLYDFFKDLEFEEKLNSNPSLIPILKGRVIEIADSGEVKIRDREQADYLSYEIKVDFDPSLDLSFAESYFTDLVRDVGFEYPSGDTDEKYKSKTEEEISAYEKDLKETANYLSTLTGYFLFGHSFDRAFYIFNGFGMNGKSLYNSIISALTGELSFIGSKKWFIEDKKHAQEEYSPHLVNLQGKRVCMTSETGKDDILNGTVLKSLTGSDEISTRQIHSNIIRRFIIIAKILLSTNYVPKMEFYDQAVIDRARIINFKNRFETDKEFADSILNNSYQRLDKIFTFAILAFSAHVKEFGFKPIKPPTCIKKSTFSTFTDSNLAIGFMNSCLTFDSAESTKRSDLNDSFRAYCFDTNGEKGQISQLADELKRKGLKPTKKKGIFVYEGIKLNSSFSVFGEPDDMI